MYTLYPFLHLGKSCYIINHREVTGSGRNGKSTKIKEGFLKVFVKFKVKMYALFFLAVWIESPTITVVETLSHPIDEVSFPAVTICPQNFNSDRWGATIKTLDFLQRSCPTHG